MQSVEPVIRQLAAQLASRYQYAHVVKNKNSGKFIRTYLREFSDLRNEYLVFLTEPNLQSQSYGRALRLLSGSRRFQPVVVQRSSLGNWFDRKSCWIHMLTKLFQLMISDAWMWIIERVSWGTPLLGHLIFDALIARSFIVSRNLPNIRKPSPFQFWWTDEILHLRVHSARA